MKFSVVKVETVDVCYLLKGSKKAAPATKSVRYTELYRSGGGAPGSGIEDRGSPLAARIASIRAYPRPKVSFILPILRLISTSFVYQLQLFTTALRNNITLHYNSCIQQQYYLTCSLIFY